MAAPVADRLVGRVLQGHIARGDRNHLRTQHPHLLYVGMLALDIGLAHVNDAFHVHQGADRGGSDTMLSGTSLRNDPSLAHAPSDQDLADRVVDLMSAGVVQVLTLEIDFAAILLAQSTGEIERRRPTYIVAKQLLVFPLECLALHHFQVGFPQLLDTLVEDLRNIGTTKLTVITILVH